MDDATVQGLVDRLAVQDVLTRYAAACDTKDFTTLRTLFADDARARYGHTPPSASLPDALVQPWMEGGDVIVDWMEEGVANLDWQHHMVSVYSVDIDGDEARTLTYLLSHQTVIGVPDEIRMMTSRYRNTLRRVDGRWRIAELDLEVGWYEERNANQKELLP